MIQEIKVSKEESLLTVPLPIDSTDPSLTSSGVSFKEQQTLGYVELGPGKLWGAEILGFFNRDSKTIEIHEGITESHITIGDLKKYTHLISESLLEEQESKNKLLLIMTEKF